MILNLPPESKDLVQHYKNLNILNHKVPCPYLKNTSEKKKPALYSGKGSPDKIENEANRLLSKYKSESLEESSIRLYMLGAGLGVDCSGFVLRVLESLLRNRSLKITKTIKQRDKSLKWIFRMKFRFYTNISADVLSSNINCINVNDLNEVVPGDILRINSGHIGIFTQVQKTKGVTTRMYYHHSTSDYENTHGVREGSILINDINKQLEHQKWTESYKDRNWMYEDYIKTPSRDKGIRRLKSLVT